MDLSSLYQCSTWEFIQHTHRLYVSLGTFFDWWTFDQLNRKYKMQNKCITGINRARTLEKRTGSL